MRHMTLEKLAAKGALLAFLHTAFIHAGPKKLAVPLLIAGQFDAATTYRNTAMHPSQFYESNPLLRPFQRNVTIFPAIAVGDSLALNLSQRYGGSRQTLRALVIGGFIGLHIWCGFHNMSVAQGGINGAGYPGGLPSSH